MNDIDFLIQSVDIVKKQFQSKDVEFVSNLYVVQPICKMLEDKG